MKWKLIIRRGWNEFALIYNNIDDCAVMVRDIEQHKAPVDEDDNDFEKPLSYTVVPVMGEEEREGKKNGED